MTDLEIRLERLGTELDRITIEEGLDPNGSSYQFTFEAGQRIGARLKELLPVDQSIVNAIVREALAEIASLLPVDPDPETIEFQTCFLSPLVSTILTGRGVTIPEMAAIAQVRTERTYRINRNGLSIIYAPRETLYRAGVNRRYSGRDDRANRLALDTEEFATKPWPAPMARAQPFFLGIIAGIKSWLEDPVVQAQIEPSLKLALSRLLGDPKLGEVFDGLIVALQRIAQGLREKVLAMKSEKEKVLEFESMLVDLAKKRTEVLATLADAGARLRSGEPIAFGEPSQ